MSQLDSLGIYVRTSDAQGLVMPDQVPGFFPGFLPEMARYLGPAFRYKIPA
jgi:hypothetical protein